MEPVATAVAPSPKAVLAGKVLSIISVLFLIFDSVTHTMLIPSVVEGFAKAGFPPGSARPIGIVEIVCLVLYVIPRTSVLGAILLTGYLGGAVATNVRMGLPLFGFVLAPVYIGIVLWLGLWLRDAALRRVVPVAPARASRAGDRLPAAS
jgi:DoxX-like protein